MANEREASLQKASAGSVVLIALGFRAIGMDLRSFLKQSIMMSVVAGACGGATHSAMTYNLFHTSQGVFMDF